ncbi:MAG: ABC transporter ATP-binding protein [Armatimonadota bacterium]|nr:ABC transporter ATP-binding protein [Armatimonadota bacterium]
MIPLLRVDGLTKYFYGVSALQGVTVDVMPGELVGVIGPNGSGKTTLFDCITGHLRPDRGRVLYRGGDITGLPPHRIALAGIGRTFQAVRVFPRLTVLDHLFLAVQEMQGDGIVARLVRAPAARRSEEEAWARAAEVLGLVGLRELENLPVTHLSYGQRKLLVLGMAIMMRPVLLLLDEPMAGVNPVVIETVMAILRALHQQGATIILVEHNLRAVMNFCQRVIVLESGRTIADGPPEEVRRNPRVLEAYFGH